jgi:hypothetical protein
MPSRRRPPKLRSAVVLCATISLAGAPAALARPGVQRPASTSSAGIAASGDTSSDLGTWLQTGGVAAALLAAGGLVRSAGRQGRQAPSPRDVGGRA